MRIVACRQRGECRLCRRYPLVQPGFGVTRFAPAIGILLTFRSVPFPLFLALRFRPLDDMDFGVAATKAVHATEPLDHRIERGEVADQMLGIEVDAHLAG